MANSAAVTRADAGKDVPVTRLAVASTIGTIIEAYDFVLYGISISAQLGGVFAGAFAPLIATALLDVSGIWLVTAYFTAMCAVSAVAAYLSPETKDSDFMGQPAPEPEIERQPRFVREPARERVRG